MNLENGLEILSSSLSQSSSAKVALKHHRVAHGLADCLRSSLSSAQTRYNLFCTFLLHIPVYIIFIKSTVDCIAHFILFHCTFYSLFYFLFYFILSFFHIFSYSYLYLYIFSCVMFHFLLIFLHCPLSGPVLTYISLLIIPCMIVYVTNNKEP